jgi:hypothetical protein
MQEVKTYRQFARDCMRLAATAKPKDKTVLLKIAEAWEQQAKAAEVAIANEISGKTDGSGISG